MSIDLTKLPDWAVIQLKKGDLEFFAKSLIESTPNKKEPAVETQNEILSADEASAFLKIAKQTLYQMTSSNRICFYKKNILF